MEIEITLLNANRQSLKQDWNSVAYILDLYRGELKEISSQIKRIYSFELYEDGKSFSKSLKSYFKDNYSADQLRIRII